MAAEPRGGRDRGNRRAAPHRRPAARRVPRPEFPELAEEARRGAVMLRALLLLLALGIAGAAYAQPEAKKDAKKEAKKEAKKPAAKAKAAVRPSWAELTADQQKILSPLKADWESLNQDRRKKWV